MRFQCIVWMPVCTFLCPSMYTVCCRGCCKQCQAERKRVLYGCEDGRKKRMNVECGRTDECTPGEWRNSMTENGKCNLCSNL